MLPTFLVIGAMKCGTTSLYYYLDAHPDIGMSIQKETDFFIQERNYEKGQTWYESRFREAGRARGECSPNYTKAHLFPGVAQRMYDLVPDARLIYMVRDPIDRMVSHYVGNRVEGREERSFSAAVTEPADNNYLMTSRYHWQLRPYLDTFGADHVLVRSLEALSKRPARVLRDICRFVGVDEDDGDIANLRRFNASRTKRRHGPWTRWVKGILSQPLKDTLRPYVPRGWIPGTSVEPPDPSPALREKLADRLRDDANALRRLTGRSFETWSV
jgi:hypothetical protein